MTKIQNYQALENYLEKITHLSNILSIACWDSATNLPKLSASNRQKEIATASAIVHEMLSSELMSSFIEKATDEIEHLNEWQRANLKKIKKSYDHATCISPEIQHEHTRISGECEFVWRSARSENDWEKLEPYLDKVFDSVKKIAKIKEDKFGINGYDILIDSFDPERKSHEIMEVYDILKTKLPPLIKRITDKQSQEKVIALSQRVDENIQKAIGLQMMKTMGFDMDKGRLDKSTHPFCSGTTSDVRITTRYNEQNFLSSLMGVIHEAGHGLYQQNLPASYQYQPVGEAKGMAFHESQSLIMEMQAGRSKEFSEHLAKILKDDFNFKGPEYSAENLYFLSTRVSPSLIRVDADEVTYPLHVIIRFEIEKAILSGELKTKDLPAYWNEKMKQYLGVTPQNDKDGCMQDIHWPSGWLGYFPSYTNGAIIASMLMKSAQNVNPEVKSALKFGDFSPLNNYLNENLRSYASSKDSADLLEISTGHRKISPEVFIEYLEQKYN